MHGTTHNEIRKWIIWKHLHTQDWYQIYWIGLEYKIQVEYPILSQIPGHIIGYQPVHSTTICIFLMSWWFVILWSGETYLGWGYFEESIYLIWVSIISL